MKPNGSIIREAIEEVISRVAGSLATVRDGDGDYPLKRHGLPVYGRLLDSVEPPVFQVFSILMVDVEHSLELMDELNDLNQTLTFARTIWVDGQILAEVDLVAHTLDDDELRVAVDRVTSIADRISPLIQAMFGGDVAQDPAERRWRLYRDTIVEAEILPGRAVPLNGPAAPTDWLFPGPVHVLTGWDPQGVSRSAELNEDINAFIAADVLRMGGRFVFGAGRSVDGDHVEPSLVVWGLDRSQARELASRASQDAIFEIDESEVRLVAAFDNRVETWSRIPAPQLPLRWNKELY